MDLMKVLKANPYRNGMGQFCTASDAANEGKMAAGGHIKVNEAIHQHMGMMSQKEPKKTTCN